MDFEERIAHSYFFAKKYVIQKGYAGEVDWQDNINFELLTENIFLKEISWVILASGLSDKVVRKVYPTIESLMFNFQSSDSIMENRESCFLNALKVFNHKGKIGAIIYIAEYIHINSFDYVRSQIEKNGIFFIKTFPFMGEATSLHFAKNIGLEVVKPDRHLLRISSTLGFKNPYDLCKQISSTINEKASIIDIVMWRYATLDKHYIQKILWYFKVNQNV